MSRPHDPIVTSLQWLLSRIILFVLLGGGLTLGLWFWWMNAGFDISGIKALDTYIDSMRGQEQKYLVMVARGCTTLGYAMVSVGYLGISLWWRGQSEIETRGTRWGGSP